MPGGVGREGVRAFCRDPLAGKFFPPDVKMTNVSSTVGHAQPVDGLAIGFTRTTPIDWLLPGVPPTGKQMEIAVAVIAGFKDGKISHEHIDWDQASVPAQVGLLDPTRMPVSGAKGARKVLNQKLPSCQSRPVAQKNLSRILPMEDHSASAEETRRELLTRMGTGLVAITVSSAQGQISPERARARGEALRQLSDEEGRTLEALGDVLLPGAAAAGIAQYVDDQLSSPAPMLMLKYVDFPGPFADFYQQGLRALDNLGRARHGRPFRELSSAQKLDLVREVSQMNPPEWTGPPAPLFYFVTRNDAVDVYYGTQEGFERLNIPYMAHILPRRQW